MSAATKLAFACEPNSKDRTKACIQDKARRRQPPQKMCNRLGKEVASSFLLVQKIPPG